MNLSTVDNSPWTLLANVFYVKVFMIFNADVVFLSIARIKFLYSVGVADKVMLRPFK